MGRRCYGLANTAKSSLDALGISSIVRKPSMTGGATSESASSTCWRPMPSPQAMSRLRASSSIRGLVTSGHSGRLPSCVSDREDQAGLDPPAGEVARLVGS